MTAPTIVAIALAALARFPGGDEGEGCGTDLNSGCFGPLSGSSCCVPSGGITCDDARCVDVVCGMDPFCCMVAWDQICADEAIEYCPWACATPSPVFSTIGEGETVAGGFWSAGVARDTDTYVFELTAQSQVMATFLSASAAEVGFLDTDGVLDCALGPEIEPLVESAPGERITVTACLEAGTHAIVVRPPLGSVVGCGTPEGAYSLTLTLGIETCTLPDPVNDICANALPITEGETPITTHDAATEPDLPDPACHAPFDLPQHDIWYRFDAPHDGRVRLSTCGQCPFDAKLAVYSGSCDSLTSVFCVSQSALCPWLDPAGTFVATGGESYLIRFSGDESTEFATLTLSYMPCDGPFTVEAIPFPPGTGGTVGAMSDDGEVVGTTAGSKGFRWSPREGHSLVTTPPGSSTLTVRDVNTEGVIVGAVKSSATQLNTPVRAHASSFEALPLLPGDTDGAALSVNDANVIVGRSKHPTLGNRPVRWVDGAIELIAGIPGGQTADAITDGGAIAGTGTVAGANGPVTAAWLLVGERLTWIVPEEPHTAVVVRALTDAHEVVGAYASARDGEARGFVWSDGAMTEIPPLDNYFPASVAIGVAKEDGLVVGNAGWDLLEPNPYEVPFFFRAGLIHRIQRFVNDDELGAFVGDVQAVNASGDMGGWVYLPSEGYTSGVVRRVTPTGDLDCDRIVDAADLALLLGQWGECSVNSACAADFTLDRVVDGADLAVVLGAWGEVPVR